MCDRYERDIARKLTDLNPTFVGAGGPGIYRADGSPAPERHGVGLQCDCPCGCGYSILCDFLNPLDGGAPLDTTRPKWTRRGDSFETLVLSPSILRLDGCRWHGYLGGADGSRPGWMVPC